MYFPGGSNGPKVSLGGRSRQESSRADVLAKSREERKKRQQQKQQNTAAAKIEVCLSSARENLALYRCWEIFLLEVISQAYGARTAQTKMECN
jgi:hypothetical protein